MLTSVKSQLTVARGIKRQIHFLKNKSNPLVPQFELQLHEPASRIVGRNDWEFLKGRRVLNSALIVEGMGDIHSDAWRRKICAEKVLVLECNKNFVFYWCFPSQLPHTQQLFLHSHPCEPSLLHCWGRSGRALFLRERFGDCKRRWAPEYSNIQVLPEDHQAWRVSSVWGGHVPLITEIDSNTFT